MERIVKLPPGVRAVEVRIVGDAQPGTRLTCAFARRDGARWRSSESGTYEGAPAGMLYDKCPSLNKRGRVVRIVSDAPVETIFHDANGYRVRLRELMPTHPGAA